MCEWEFDWKVKIRYFNTSDVISTYVKGPSVAFCWRKCGKIWKVKGSVDSKTETGLYNWEKNDWVSTNEDFSAKMEM